jgi:hypothetical protein
MMKRFSYYLLILAVLGGCAAERKVVDNTFYCSFPKFTIRINPDYEYIGQRYTRSERWGYDTYVFILADNNRIKKVIAIDIEKISTYYVSDFWGNVENKLDSGVCELGGKKYHHYTNALMPSMKWNTTRLVSDKGFILPNCLLTKRVGRIEGAKGNILFKIYYFEDVTDLGYACRSWKNKDTLSKDRLDRLAQFDKNWHEVFEVLPFRKPPDSK